MNTNERNRALLEVIRQGLEISGIGNTQNMLGDRDNYLGLSDLARYAECPRAALAAKIFPARNSLGHLLTLQRGHWFENGLQECLESLGLKFLPQLEISVTYQEIPINAHLDFTLVWNRPYPAIRIIEMKSMNRLPEEAYKSHVFQAQAQVNLLRKFWNDPVFAVKNDNGEILAKKLCFPEICKKILAMDMPESPKGVCLESWLLCLSMEDAIPFGPYVYEEEKLEEMFLLAQDCWNLYGILRHDTLALNSMSHAKGFHPLCNFCQFSADCPKFTPAGTQQQWNEAIIRHEQLKEQRSVLDGQIREIEAALKLAHQHSGTDSWIDTGTYRFRVTNLAGRKTLNRDSLQEELKDIFISAGLVDIDVEDLFARHEKTGAASSRLSIMKTD